MNGQTEIQWGEVADLVENNALDWKEVKVEDIKADFAHALSTGPFGSAISSKYFLESGFPVIRGANLSQNVSERFSDDGLVFISPEKAQEFRRSIVRKGDLIFTCWGTINQVGLIDGKSKYEEYVISNKQMKLTPDPKKADPYFLYYLFSSPDYQSRILNNDIGSTIPGFNLGQLKNMEMLLPSISEQHAIVGVLSSLDDKIELLHRQNATLEALAETLFRQWFVEEAKEEWEDCKLEDLCITVSSGGTPSTKIERYYNGEINWYSTKELKDNFLFKSENRITQDGLENSSAKLFPRNTVVIAIYAAPTVGRLGILVNESAFNQAACGLVADSSVCCFEFLYLFLKLQRADLNAMASGSAQQNLNVGKIRNYPAFKVPNQLMISFKETVSPLFDKVRENSTQIQTLSNLRDTLLPKLMSGEVRVAY